MTEENKRLAQTRMPDGTLVDRPWTVAERYMLYARGFRDGASTHAIKENLLGLGAYDRGYSDGKAATSSAVAAYAKEIGYVPSILR